MAFQGDVKDVPNQVVTPSDFFSVFCMDMTEEANKTKGRGVCFMVNTKW